MILFSDIFLSLSYFDNSRKYKSKIAQYVIWKQNQTVTRREKVVSTIACRRIGN